MDTEKIDYALSLLADEATVVEETRAASGGRGRPAILYEITLDTTTLILTKQEYEAALEKIKTGDVPAVVQSTMTPMTADEFEALSRLATPKLAERVYLLAMKSTDLKEVVSAARFMSEYGFGRPTQKQEILVKADIVRRGWNDMEALEAEVVDEAG